MAAAPNQLKVSPKGRDSQKAAEASSALKTYRSELRRRGRTERLPELELPSRIIDALEAMLEQFAEGQTVVVAGEPGADVDLSTTEAARRLGMSRPTLINLLEEGVIGYRYVGSHRRIPEAEVRAYREQMDDQLESARDRRRRRLEGLRRMAELTHEAGQDY